MSSRAQSTHTGFEDETLRKSRIFNWILNLANNTFQEDELENIRTTTAIFCSNVDAGVQVKLCMLIEADDERREERNRLGDVLGQLAEEIASFGEAEQWEMQYNSARRYWDGVRAALRVCAARVEVYIGLLQSPETAAGAAFPAALIMLFRERAQHFNNEVNSLVSAEWKVKNLLRKLQARHDVENGIWPRQLTKEEVAAEIKRPPFQHRLNTPGNWVFVRELGGGMAKAALWCDIDPENGRILRRMVRKDTPYSQSMWQSPTWWQGPLSNRAPKEYYIQTLLNRRDERARIAQVFAYEVDETRMVSRLYMPYCIYGDLSSFSKNYARIGEDIPEPFMWWVFETLVDAALVMQHGGNSPSDAQHRDRHVAWQQIVHNDLKPENIFLDAAYESTPGYKRYPSSLVADFGIAAFQAEDDPMNPQKTRSGGTNGYKAPEQIDFKRIDPDIASAVDQWKLSSHTNVWGIGAIMAALATKQSFQQGSESQYIRGGVLIPGWRTVSPRQLRVSDELHEAILQCLRTRPSERPTLEQLKTHIHDFIKSRSAADDPMGVYMHFARLLDHQPSNNEFDVQFLEERYKLGFALNKLDHAGKEVQQGTLVGRAIPGSSAAPERSRVPATSEKESAASGAGRSLTGEELVEQQRIRAEMEALTMNRGAFPKRTPPPEAFGIGAMQQAAYASDRARPYDTPNHIQVPDSHPAPRLPRMGPPFELEPRASRPQDPGASVVTGPEHDVFSTRPSRRGSRAR
ncbi:kinase-like protein [Teratosphaeria nubilosa]|uniref:Kinase-like protein n=1 Tax=Teratosphaeria nubilosa TaxID=161662 RepID=A0A6G1L7L4_9PEZI|nr:kinase-like protein [Teratosphaeria nubilosa]